MRRNVELLLPRYERYCYCIERCNTKKLHYFPYPSADDRGRRRPPLSARFPRKSRAENGPSVQGNPPLHPLSCPQQWPLRFCSVDTCLHRARPYAQAPRAVPSSQLSLRRARPLCPFSTHHSCSRGCCSSTDIFCSGEVVICQNFPFRLATVHPICPPSSSVPRSCAASLDLPCAFVWVWAC